jgi:transposase-like protein
MPWKASSVMEERLRFVARLLEGEAMTDICRDFGVSRKTGYKILTPPWGDRGGVSALGTRRSLSRFPPAEPWQSLDAQLAKQARNRDHDSSDKCGQGKKQQKVPEEQRQVKVPKFFAT